MNLRAHEGRAAVAGIVACALLVGCSSSSGAPDAQQNGNTPSPTSSASPSESRAAAVDAWQRGLEEKLSVPPLPSFTIPTGPFQGQQRRVARLLDVQPGLYRGIGVVDARCGKKGDVNPEDQQAGAAPRRSGHYKDGTRDITVQADGAGVYESGALRISVHPDGSGDYTDGTTKVSVRADGSGLYRDGQKRLNVQADGSGSYDDDTIRLWRNSDGSAGYNDGDSRVVITATGSVTTRGDRVHTDAALRVLQKPFPRFPAVAPARLNGRPTGRSCGSVIRLDTTILFDSDKSDLKPQAVALLGRVARLLEALSYPHIQVNGHTDLVGTKAHGLILSRQRAAAVVAALTQAGTPKASMTAVGYGESRPLHPEVRPDGTVDLEARRLNRRVEIVLLDRDLVRSGQ
jgi:OOP family OmpA-OmpF porin